MREMKSTIDINTSLTRHSDTGNITTSFSYVDGMPRMLVIKQHDGVKMNKIELTLPEAKVFQYIMNEFRAISEIVDNMDNEEERPRSLGMALAGR